MLLFAPLYIRHYAIIAECKYIKLLYFIHYKIAVINMIVIIIVLLIYLINGCQTIGKTKPSLHLFTNLT